MKRVIQIFVGLIAVAIIGVAVFGILPTMGVGNPAASIFDAGKNAATNMVIDASGIKDKISDALESNRDTIASYTGLTHDELDQAIQDLDIESWKATSLPADAKPTGKARVEYEGTPATITTYDDPSVVTVEAYGQTITLEVPESAQAYLPYLDYLK